MKIKDNLNLSIKDFFLTILGKPITNDQVTKL